MDELQNLIDSHPEPFKVEITCWGCGAKENEDENGKRFMECPHCTERKLIKSRFCSQECFGKSWVRHKQWHKDQKESNAKLLGSNRGDVPIEKLLKQSPYNKLIAKASIHVENNEISLARPILRKAMKLDARRPEAYYNLGLLYNVSGLAKEAVQHYEMAIERWAFVTITGSIGDYRIDNPKQNGEKNWMKTVANLIPHYLTEEFVDWEKPTWYCQDAILKRIVKLVKDIVYADVDSSDNTKIEVSSFVAYILSGIVSGGIFHLSESIIPDDRTPEDLIEAAACFRAACSDGNENNSMYLSHDKTMSDIARFRSDNNIVFGFDDIVSSQFRPGSWVVMHGLTSTTGVLLNQKPALVYGKDKTTGRIIVQIDKNKVQKKLFLPRNLLELPMKDNILAISSTMEKSAQWIYFQFIIPKLFGKLLEELGSGSN